MWCAAGCAAQRRARLPWTPSCAPGELRELFPTPNSQLSCPPPFPPFPAGIHVHGCNTYALNAPFCGTGLRLRSLRTAGRSQLGRQSWPPVGSTRWAHFPCHLAPVKEGYGPVSSAPACLAQLGLALWKQGHTDFHPLGPSHVSVPVSLACAPLMLLARMGFLMMRLPCSSTPQAPGRPASTFLSLLSPCLHSWTS